MCLTKVIKKLKNKQKFVSFRESKLTRLLKPVLSGNSRTLIICTINPLRKYEKETLRTLNFGSQAAGIKMRIKQNFIENSKKKVSNDNEMQKELE